MSFVWSELAWLPREEDTKTGESLTTREDELVGRGGAGEERSKQFAADLLSYGLQFTEDKWTIGLEGGRTSVVLIVLMRDQNFSHPAIALYFLWLIWTYCW